MRGRTQDLDRTGSKLTRRCRVPKLHLSIAYAWCHPEVLEHTSLQFLSLCERTMKSKGGLGTSMQRIGGRTI